MTALTRPFRRLRGRTSADQAVEAAPVAAVPAERPGVAVDILESDPLFVYLQSAPGPVDLDQAGARLPRAGAVARRRRGACRPARDPGRAHRHAEPRTAPLRAGLLDRRQAAARDAGRPGRAGHPRGAARPRAGRRGRRARALRAGAQGRAADPAAVPPAGAAQPARVADRRVLRPGAGRGRRLLRLHRPWRGPHRCRRRRRHRQGRPGGPRHGSHALHPPGRGAAADRARQGPRPRERAAGARDAGPDVRHLPVRRPGARDRPLRVRERRSQPALRANGRRCHRAAGHGTPARAHARHRLRGDRGIRGPGRCDAALLGRTRRAAWAWAGDVRLPAASRGDGHR